MFKPSYETPTLHIIGRHDVIVVEERSHVLAESNHSKYKRVEVHDGGRFLHTVTPALSLSSSTGHFIPTKTSWRKFICNWMTSPQTEWPSPSTVPYSAPPSGAATPGSGERARHG